MIYLASKRNIPIILSNARLSKESFNNYFRLRFFMKDFFKQFSLVLAQYDKHIKYFKKIGIEENKIIKIGSVKFDNNVNHSLGQRKWIIGWGFPRPTDFAKLGFLFAVIGDR